MHIPRSATQEITILSFQDALKSSGRSGEYDSSCWLYVPDHYTEYRYILGTQGVRPLICIGVNPSTAAPGALDNTLKSVERIARFNGFDSFIMFNLYAQRATSPNDMDLSLNEQLHRENMEAFRYILEKSGPDGAVLWAAWGSVIEKRAYLSLCAEDMITLGEQYGAAWFTAGPRSKQRRHPHHPLYLKSETALDPFDDLKDYFRSLRRESS